MPKTNWGGGFSGAASGAATGASIGGPWGAAIGGVLGGVAGLFGGKKKKKKPKQISTLDPKQQALNAQQHEAVLGKGPLADLYNYNPEQANSVFDQTIANPAWRNFAEKGAPTITGSFRNQGLQNSSYVGDALAKSGRDIQEGLQGQRAGYLYGQEQEARNAKRSAVENLQNRQTFAVQQPGQGDQSSGGGWFDNILKSVSGSPEASGALQDMALKYLPGGV